MMQTSNPFELILDKLERLQTTVDIMSINAAVKKKQPVPLDPNRIIDLPEAAKILCKPVGTVRGYIHSRSLPAKLVGKSYLIKYSELMQWFETFQSNACTDANEADSATAKMLALHNRYKK
ncbi:MAG TPA: helix-turn-helix domain-containing protein [Arachidicoccus soli]|nr:helix-turn-helix domain-containing protein [Arachidicoccus soli]